MKPKTSVVSTFLMGKTTLIYVVGANIFASINFTNHVVSINFITNKHILYKQLHFAVSKVVFFVVLVAALHRF